MSDEPQDTAVADAIPGEAEEITADGTPGTDVVPAGPAGQIIRADEPEEILEKASRIAGALSKLIDGQGLAADVGGGKKHVEVGGWQALGALLGALGGQPLHAETAWTRPVRNADGSHRLTEYTATVRRYYKQRDGGGLREEVTYDVSGHDWEASVEIRTPDGHVVGSAEAMCGRDEERWGKAPDYAVRSMAETRAEGRAFRRAAGWLVKIAGYSPTPAEEMPPEDAPEAMPLATDAQAAEGGAAIASLLPGTPEQRAAGAKEIGAWLRQTYGGVPLVAVQVAKAVAVQVSALSAKPEPAAAGPPAEPAGDPPEAEAVPAGAAS